jgi:ATP/ADP translocase
MEFTEIIWKATVKLAYSNKQDYMEFMGNYSTVVSTRNLHGYEKTQCLL